MDRLAEQEISEIIVRLIASTIPKDIEIRLNKLHNVIACLFDIGAEPRQFVKHNGTAALAALIQYTGSSKLDVSVPTMDDRPRFDAWTRIYHRAARELVRMSSK